MAAMFDVVGSGITLVSGGVLVILTSVSEDCLDTGMVGGTSVPWRSQTLLLPASVPMRIPLLGTRPSQSAGQEAGNYVKAKMLLGKTVIVG
mmetsp:Transcript_122728/g.229363  ORF Transcript_122728/g.229363 Transcript_122728/m.229363 type:complete len:91 (-) Transcript_122728:130-402(-)